MKAKYFITVLVLFSLRMLLSARTKPVPLTNTSIFKLVKGKYFSVAKQNANTATTRTAVYASGID